MNTIFKYRISNKLGILLSWLTLFALIINSQSLIAQTTTPTKPVWYDGNLFSDEPIAGIQRQHGWVTVSPERPAFFQLSSGQLAQLVRREADSSQPIQIHIAQGRGMFRAKADIDWTEHRQTVTNPRSRDVWVLLQSATPTDVKLQVSEQFALRNRDFWSPTKVASSTNDITVRNIDSETVLELKPLHKDETFTYHAKQDERIKLDFFVDFDAFGDLNNVPVHFHWQIDQQTPSTSVRYAGFNFRTVSQHECTLALSFREPLVVELKRGETFVFQASQAGFFTTSSNNKGDYLFSRNRPSLEATEDSTLDFSRLSEKWYPLLRAYNLSVPLDLTDENNKLIARRSLYPQQNKHATNWLYSVRGLSLDAQDSTGQSSRLEGLHFSSKHSRSNLNRLVLGNYYRLDTTQPELTFTLPPNRVLKELELEVATTDTNSTFVSLWVSADNAPAEQWLLSPALQALSGKPSILSMYLEASLRSSKVEPVSYTDNFAHLKQRAPMVRTNLVYFPIPDAAKKITIRTDKHNATNASIVSPGAFKTSVFKKSAFKTSTKEHWISVRDFVYRSNISDVTLLNEPHSKTLPRLLNAFNVFREYEARFVNSEKASLAVLLQDLEAKQLSEQRDLIQWARFFQIVKNAQNVLEKEYVAEATSARLNRFNDINNPIWGDIETWLNGPQPATSLNVLIGLTLHHPNKTVRLHAMNVLLKHADELVSINRLEQIMLAYLYQDMSQLGAFLPKLMPLWSELGKYNLISLLPKPVETGTYFDLLNAVSERNGVSELKKLYDNSSYERENAKLLYQAASSFDEHKTHGHAGKELALSSYLEKFAHWKTNTQPVQQYTQHLILQHLTRAELTQRAFMVGPNHSLTLKSNELLRYRLLAAPVLNTGFSAGFSSEGSEQKRENKVTIGKQLHLITSADKSNWFTLLPKSRSANILGSFSTLYFSDQNQNQPEVKITANQPTVVYLERMEDPAGLLQTLSMPLERITKNAYQDTISTLLSPIQTYWSSPALEPNTCGELEVKNLRQNSHVLPVNIGYVTHQQSPSRSKPLTDKFRARQNETGFDIQTLSLGQSDVATSAKLIHLSEDRATQRRYPNLRAIAFEQVRWRELLDVQQHAGVYSLQRTKPVASTQAESQRIELSNEFKQDYLFNVSGQSAQGVTVYSPTNQSIKLNIAARKQLFNHVKLVTVFVKVGNKAVQQHQLNTGSEDQITLALKQGNNVIKIWMAEDSLQETVFYDFVLPKNIQPINAAATRYFSATSGKGIDLKIRGPQRLKVVMANSVGETKVTEQHLTAGLNDLHFDAKGDFQYFRFFVLQENYEPTATKLPTTPVVSLTPSCLKEECLTRNSVLDNQGLKDLLALGSYPAIEQPSYIYKNKAQKSLPEKQQTNIDSSDPFLLHSKEQSFQVIDASKPTLGLDFRVVNRDSTDEDPDSVEQLNDTFFEINGWLRQNRVNGNQVVSLDTTRRRFSEADVYRVNARNDWLRSGNRLPFSYALEGEVWHQGSTDLNSSISSIALYGRSRYNVQITPRITLSTRGRAWFRESNADSDTDFSLVDSDVWSEFKEDHRYGLGFAQRATYRHRLDSEIYAEANLLSNESPLSLDRHGVILGWRSYFGRISSDINLNHRQFRNDSDRNGSFSRTDINLSADWFLPLSQRSNFRLSSRVRFNTNDSDISWWINLGWFDHAGQQLSDFRPDELRFRNARDWWLR